jgi:hypothetical protein
MFWLFHKAIIRHRLKNIEDTKHFIYKTFLLKRDRGVIFTGVHISLYLFDTLAETELKYLPVFHWHEQQSVAPAQNESLSVSFATYI